MPVFYLFKNSKNANICNQYLDLMFIKKASIKDAFNKYSMLQLACHQHNLEGKHNI